MENPSVGIIVMPLLPTADKHDQPSSQQQMRGPAMTFPELRA
jgi:hypothetical protein